MAPGPLERGISVSRGWVAENPASKGRPDIPTGEPRFWDNNDTGERCGPQAIRSGPIRGLRAIRGQTIWIWNLMNHG